MKGNRLIYNFVTWFNHLTFQVHTKLKTLEDFQNFLRTSNYLHLLLKGCTFYLDLCTSSSISIINSGNANPFTSSQEPVGNPFL